jgi:hypothetical protein
MFEHINMKIVTCIPYYDSIHARTKATAEALQRGGITIATETLSGSRIDINRNELVRTALEKHNADAVLFIDSDVAAEIDASKYLDGMIKVDADIVSGAYETRIRDARSWCAAELHEQTEVLVPKTATGILPVSWCGMGFALIRRCVFESLTPEWFYGSCIIDARGEDITFCRRVTDAGMRIVLDTSAKLDHLPRENRIVGKIGASAPGDPYSDAIEALAKVQQTLTVYHKILSGVNRGR